MGQYYKDVKIGTCESMYYLRLDEALSLAKMGLKDDDGIPFSVYVSDEVTRFRFPFPDEDGKTLIGEEIKYDRGVPLYTGGIEILHKKICLSNFPAYTHNVNIFLPCPYSEEFKAKGIEISRGGAGESVLVVKMEGMRNGKRKAIFSCARCGEPQTLKDDDVVKLKEYNMEVYKETRDEDSRNAFYRSVIERIEPWNTREGLNI